jgi:hypothetical protein
VDNYNNCQQLTIIGCNKMPFFCGILYINKKQKKGKIKINLFHIFLSYIIYMAPTQKQTIIKKPGGTGNISITIENNLKSTNPAPPPVVVKKRRRRRQPTETDVTNSKIEDMLRGGGGGGGGAGIPLKDVSYIKPPNNNFTVWRNHMDSINTTTPMLNAQPTITEGQARQIGYLPPVQVIPPAQLALPPPPPPPPPPPLRPPPLALPPPPPPVDNSFREFLMFMASQQGRGIANNFNNLQHDNAYDEPMQNRYAVPLRPNNKVQEIDEEVLKESGATNEQIEAYKASVNTTNDDKLTAAGIDPEKVKKISRARYEGTFQGGRNLVPQGEYKDDPEFIKSYKKAHAQWLNESPSQRKTFLNTGNKYEYVSKDKVTSMYNAGAEHAAKGKLILTATRQQRNDPEFMRGYKDIRDGIDMDAELVSAGAATGAVRGASTTRDTGTGTPTLANKLPSPQKPPRGVGDLTGVFEAYARGLGQAP